MKTATKTMALPLLALKTGATQASVDGEKRFYEGEKGSERLVRIEFANGKKRFYEGDDERLVRSEDGMGNTMYYDNFGMPERHDMPKGAGVLSSDYNYSDLMRPFLMEAGLEAPITAEKWHQAVANLRYDDDITEADVAVQDLFVKLSSMKGISWPKRQNGITILLRRERDGDPDNGDPDKQIVTYEDGQQIVFLRNKWFYDFRWELDSRDELLEAVKIRGSELTRRHTFVDDSDFWLSYVNYVRVFDPNNTLRRDLPHDDIDREIVVAAIRQDGTVLLTLISLGWVPSYADDRELIREAVKQNGDVLRELSREHERNPFLRLSAAATSVHYAVVVLLDMKADLAKYKESVLLGYVLAFKRSAFGKLLFTSDAEFNAYKSYGEAASNLAAYWATPTQRKLALSLDEIEMYEEIQRLAEEVIMITESPDGILFQEVRKREYEEDVLLNPDAAKQQRTGTAVTAATSSAHWDHALFDGV